MGSTVPATFQCSEHNNDLTTLVVHEIEDKGLVVARSGMRVRRSSGPQPFKVAVRCPGGDGHDVVCRGTYQAGT